VSHSKRSAHRETATATPPIGPRASETRALSHECSGPTRNDHRTPRHCHRHAADRPTRERDADAVVRVLRSHSERSPHSATPSPLRRPSAHARAGRGCCRASAQVPLGTITAHRDTDTDTATPPHRHQPTRERDAGAVARALRSHSERSPPPHRHRHPHRPARECDGRTGAPSTSVHVPLGAIGGPYTRRRRCPTGKGSAVVGRSRGARAAPRRARKEIRPRGSRRAWPATTCGWRPGSCG